MAAFCSISYRRNSICHQAASGRFRKLTSRKNDHWQWLGDYQIDDNSLTRFSVPLRLKRLVRTAVAEEAADQINALTPGRYKRHAHEWLIQHGMQMCTARNPRCNGCCVANLCSHTVASTTA